MRDLLKLTACGSVDDGKSTLLGHLIYECGVYRDQWAEILALQEKTGAARPDYSLLLDGLEAEREQHITIDVAYRYFSTPKRSFIVADCPGHVEYTRNMAVGAAFADVAVILVDASKGIREQTLRHQAICSLMGIRDYVFAVNKMDLVGYDRYVFRRIRDAVREIADDGADSSCTVIPVSAAEGDGLTTPSENMPWYQGPPLLQCLEEIRPRRTPERGFVLPVQRVGKTRSGGRGYQGTVESGRILPGDTLTVLPGGTKSRVREILNAGAEAGSAESGQAVTIALTEERDVSRGSVLTDGAGLAAAKRFSADLLWLSDTPLKPGASYILKLGCVRTSAEVSELRSVTKQGKSGRELRKNQRCKCTVSSAAEVVTAPFREHRGLGSFLLIDRYTCETAAFGTVLSVKTEAGDIVPPKTAIGRERRAASLGQKPLTLWFTGLPASGKSSIAARVEEKLASAGKHCMLLDGDALRSGINRNLGFSPADRRENIRVAAETARLLNDAGLIVLAALVSPKQANRDMAREIVGAGFYEIFVSAPPEVCAARDEKGHYARAKTGALKDFTGVSAPYEIPEHPDLTLDAANENIDECAARAVAMLREKRLM